MKQRNLVFVLAVWVFVSLLVSAAFAQSSPSETYKSYLEAVYSGDLVKGKTLLAEKCLKDMEASGDADNFFKMMGGMEPKEVQIINEDVQGDTASLEVKGKNFGGDCKGTITLNKENGEWKVAKEAWHN